MISADPPPFDRLVTRLAAKARALAEARAEAHALARRDDPARWRRARLVWPLFAKD
ncbi:MAG TPA: hypothetical protein PKD92_11760 [Novosphingobium sp.]|nr:hypothetical protein [Novosphingobium sp.]HMP57235.1 hypothetical protein [Novosphingobium sp.]